MQYNVMIHPRLLLYQHITNVSTGQARALHYMVQVHNVVTLQES